MGALVSRFWGETYYASYEKAFAKHEQSQKQIQRRLATRTVHQATCGRLLFRTGVVLTLLAAAYASWIFRQDAESFTAKGRVVRLSLFLAVPVLMALSHHGLAFVFAVLHRWDERQLRKHRRAVDEMVKELKDRNRYSRIQELLQKYDPEERQKKELLEKMKRHPAPIAVESNAEQKASIGTSLMYGAGKVIDSVANKIIGDQPELLAEVEKLRTMLGELEAKCAALRKENADLRGQLTPGRRSDSATSHHDANASPTS